MIYNIFHLGLLDVKKNIKKLFIFNIIILLITIPIIFSVDSTLRIIFKSDINTVVNNKIESELVTISFEEISDDVKKQLFEFYKVHTKTYYVSDYFSGKFNQEIMYIDGRSDKLFKNKSYLLSEKYITSSFLKNIDNKILFANISFFNFDISNNLYVYEITDEEEILKCYKNMSKYDLFGMIENTKTEDLNLILILKEILKNSFVELEINNIENSEIKFLFKYIYVYIILVLILLVFSLYYFYEEMFVKLRNEYKVHYITGSTLKLIFLRSFFINIVIVLNNFIFLNILNRFNINNKFYIILIISLIYTLIFFINNFIFFKKIKNSIFS